MLCYAKSFKNFIRINDDGEEVIPTIVEKEVPEADPNQDMTQPPNRQELLSALNDYIKSFDNLPEHAMMTPITHIDLKNSLTIVYAILKDLKWSSHMKKNAHANFAIYTPHQKISIKTFVR